MARSLPTVRAAKEATNDMISIASAMFPQRKKVKLPLYQTVKVHRVVRCQGSHIF
jgi:hypothetical protein